MKKKTNWYHTLPLFAGLALGSVGCEPTFETKTEDELKKNHGMTHEEALAGVAYADRWRFTTPNPDGTFAFNYSSLTTADQIAILQRMRDNIGQFLNPENKEDTAYVDYFGIRAELEKQEEIYEYRLDRFTHVQLYELYKAYMNNTPLKDQPVKRPHTLSDTMILYPENDLTKRIKFTDKYVEDAREQGKLTLEHIFKENQEYTEEEPNPSYPHKDPINKTRWVQKKRSYIIHDYDCDAPQDHRIDYIELYREKEGVKEQHPAIKIFRPHGTSTMSIIVLDDDAANERGHGIPDEIINVGYYGITTGEFFGAKNPELIEKIFIKKGKENRIKKEIPPLTTYNLTRTGEITVNAFETSTTGFNVPIDYANEDYQTWIAFKKQELPNPTDLKQSPKKTHTIEYIAREYHTSDRRVVEYFAPREDLKDNILSFNLDYKTNIIEMVFSDGRVERGSDIYFCKKNDQGNINPFRIGYDEGTQWRYELYDEDEKEPRFEKRKKTRQPLELDLRHDSK